MQAAKIAYQKVIEIDPRNRTALAFLGITYHLLEDIEAAIVKYHEVRRLQSLYSKPIPDTCQQTLSIDPINGQVLELLELALESSADMGTFGVKGVPGGEEAWAQKMREHRDRDKGKQIATRDFPPHGLRDTDDEMNLG